MSKLMQVDLKVNGTPVTAIVPGDMKLLDFLRRELGLVGAKNGCSTGHCGACTVILNGEPVRSCLVKMHKANGGWVETIEGLARDGLLHPIQRAFLEAGAVQCGFCTPGMIMSTKALLDRCPIPTDEQIKEAFKYNLCRCTGYKSIVEAVKFASRWLREGKSPETCEEPRTGHAVGSPVPVLQVGKVTGAPLFTDDILCKGALIGKVLLPTYPHARIISLDVSKAKAMPGVVAVLTAGDIPGRNAFGLIRPDQPVMARDVVRFCGEVVAVVVAEREDQAAAALEAIEVRYEPLPVIENPKQALSPGAPDLRGNGNILSKVQIRKGDPERAFAKCDVVVEDDYYTPFIEHAYMEPEAAVATYQDGEVTVWTASQSSHAFRDMIAASLALPPEKVRVIYRQAGGAFGGREEPTIQIHCALAAMKTGRPVKMVLSREESIKMSTKRHAEYLRYKIGATRDGRLVAGEVTIYADTGAYASVGEAVIFRSATTALGPYRFPHARVDAYAVHTNNIPAGAMRGFGSTQTCFACEVHMDKLAQKLGIDPLDFREMNALDVGDTTITGQKLEFSVGIKGCLRRIRAECQARGLPAVDDPEVAVGIGVACGFKNVGIGQGIPDGAGAKAELMEDGHLRVIVGCVDVGQGAETAMAQIAADSFGISLKRVEILSSDTRCAPNAGVTTASRQTFISGNAVRLACERLRERIRSVVARAWEVPVQSVVVADDKVRGSEHEVSLAEAAVLIKESGEPLVEEVWYDPPETRDIPANADEFEPLPPEKTRLHFAYCYGAQAAVVAVNKRSGEVQVLRVVAAHDVGRAINPRLVKGQIEGGIMMGIGYALSEEMRLREGIPVTTTLKSLGVPGISHLPPDIVPIIVEDHHPLGPFGAKGMGELPMNPTAPAIVNAIHNAVGVWVNNLPIRWVDLSQSKQR